MGTSEGPEVIVVGAGPTGLMLSRELALAGVQPRVVERRKTATSESRALGLQARTLEVFDMRGLADEVVSEGNPIPRVRLSLGRSILNLKRLDTRFGQLHITPQSRTEAILESQVAAMGVAVQRDTEVTGVEQKAEHVVVRLRSGDREWEERARWVVGCDGPRSVVRGSQGIGFPGYTYPYTIIVADVLVDEEPADPLLIHVGRHGLVVSTDFGDGRFRMGVIDRKKPWSDEPLGIEEVRSTLTALFGRDIGPRDPSWTSRFRISERQATAYRKGRVLLAGDAAHIHSPLGGQGLNLGLQDAVNLGWKLAAVIRGDVPGDILDTYEAERRPVSNGVIKATDFATRMMTSPKLAPRVLRQIIVPVALRLGPTHQWLAGGLSGISVRYHDADAPGRTAKNRAGKNAGENKAGKDPVAPGDRLPDVEIRRPGALPTSLFKELRTGRFVLVDQDGRIESAVKPWRDRVDVVSGRIPQPEFKGASGILSRPDGYCAWAGGPDDLDGLTDALQRWAGQSLDVARHRG